MNADVQQRIDWRDWLRRWDAQQVGYVPDREARFTVLFDALAALLPASFVALDLACGPGSISQRLLARFPGARAIAVDIDPVMLGHRAGRARRGRWSPALDRSRSRVVRLAGGGGRDPGGRSAHRHRATLAPAGTVGPSLPGPRALAAARRPLPQRRPHGLQSSVADLYAPEPAGPR